jgi:hypothetical protein
MKRALVFGLSAVAVALAACQVIVGIEHVPKDQAPVTSGEGGSSSGVPANDPCKHAFPPAVADKDDPGDDLPPIYLAAVKLSFINPTEHGVSGYDLDKSCTCDKRPGTAFDGGAPCVPPPGGQLQCDPDGGLDNSALALFNQFNLAAQISSKNGTIDDSFNNDAVNGVRDILFYIQGWTGKPNDSDVKVFLFVSNGANQMPIDLDGGTGEWSYPSSVQLQGTSLIPTTVADGYVSNGTLVVAIKGGVSILLGGVGLTFNDAIIIGDLSIASNNIVKFDGVVGGRIKATDLLTAAGQFNVGNNTPACMDKSGLFTLIKTPVCAAPDITSSDKQDFKGNVCDSISSSIAIVALTTKIGGTEPKDFPKDSTTNPCAPGQPGVDPDLYKCN